MKNITHIYNEKIVSNSSIDVGNKISFDQLSTVPNGSLDNIFCDCLDSLDFQTREQTQQLLFKKVKIEGKIVLTIINSKLLAKQIMNDTIGMEQLNYIMPRTLSLTDDYYNGILSDRFANLKILKVDIDSIYNNITLQRIS